MSRFELLAYTGRVLETRLGSLVFDIAGMQTKSKMPILREHKRDRVVGYGKARNDGRNLYIDGDFSKSSPDGREVLDLAIEGFPWQASVGIWPRKKRRLSNGTSATINGRNITGPAEIWEESDVGEVSFVSVAADPGTSARLNCEAKTMESITLTAAVSVSSAATENFNETSTQEGVTMTASDQISEQIVRIRQERLSAGQPADTDAVLRQLRAESPELLQEYKNELLGT